MRLRGMIIASVATHGVFERFAKLSDKDKKKVVEKVKDKVKTKSKGKKDEKPAKGKKDEKPAKGKKDKKPAKGKGKIPPQFLKKDDKKDEKDKAEKPAKDEKDKAEKPAKGKIPPQFLKKDDKAEEGKEEGMAEEADGLEGIVDGLVKEVEVIKGDGKVEMSEVMGLIEKMMGMVDTLVNAKAPKQKKASEDIADRVARSVVSEINREGLSDDTDDWNGSDVENLIRDHLSGTPRKTNERLMYNSLKRQFKGLSSREFGKIWKDLVDEDYLVAIPGGNYVWEM